MQENKNERQYSSLETFYTRSSNENPTELEDDLRNCLSIIRPRGDMEYPFIIGLK